MTIARIDAWPADPHANTLRKRLPRWRHVPSMIEGHHVHRFADNAALGAVAFEPARNLPVAMPVPGDLRSFRDFLRTVEAEFRIAGLVDIPPPDSWESLI
ncbi:hypothetical protein J2S22_000947 [Rhodoplanes tepidamans]|uniref:JmjN domain-containing protein n=1 Tax=Rhodoplanes tepidamans TaxID=200616 RepID=A0ABT5JJ62_RHOTP|nr:MULTISPECIES: hypothetical protein [Rhodoplanes]MDC7789614.1 hypothetical protein [Rhodoplanes tepidamans]MDQ0354030.1 hypothetical protein [Rhodoplanes tepidamans]